MKPNADNSLDKVASYLARQRDLRLGIVFGSLAEGRGNYDSDLDIAVLGQCALSAERRLELIEGLARIVGRSVDLVDLRTAGIPIARTALLEGKVVFSRDASIYPAQVSRVLVDSADFLPYRNRLLKQRRDAWIQ